MDGEAPAPDTDWRRLALHALHDLRLLGVPITKIRGVTPEVVEQVDEYDRNMDTYS